MSQITTHILDTTRGMPAEGVPIILFESAQNDWVEIARGNTNQDGRISDLLAKDASLKKGMYKLRFETGAYFLKSGMKIFYPIVEIIFNVEPGVPYHLPLLLNPFGYTTYRGS